MGAWFRVAHRPYQNWTVGTLLYHNVVNDSLLVLFANTLCNCSTECPMVAYPGVGKITRVESHHPLFEAGFRGFKSPLVHQKRVQHIGKPVENLTKFCQKVH